MLKIDFRREGPRLVRDYAQLLLGAVLAGAAFAWFFLAHELAPGAITGIAAVPISPALRIPMNDAKMKAA